MAPRKIVTWKQLLASNPACDEIFMEASWLGLFKM
jgi:hypothetical protein